MPFIQRAKPLLGTLVIIRVHTELDASIASGVEAAIEAAIRAAFKKMDCVQRAMSAHDTASDLARIAGALPNSSLRLDPDTVKVLQLAKHWYRVTLGAFDPVMAAHRLFGKGLRPAFQGTLADPLANLEDLHIEGPDRIRLRRPLRLDLGGIAKGYAVDQAHDILQAQGLREFLVNAGGDLRASGDRAWPLMVRDAMRPTRTSGLTPIGGLRNQALASSTSSCHTEFVPTLKRYAQQTSQKNTRKDAQKSAQKGARQCPWQACSVLARDCVTADVLTKWGLQTENDGPRMSRHLHQLGAQIWRH